MNRRLAFFDIICYLAIPFMIWNYGREFLGDYWAILLSTVPGIIYTIYRFWSERQFNILGFFIISSLLISTMVNLLSGSAESMLWNQVYLGFFTAVVFAITIAIKRPLAMYFAADVAALQGYPRKNSLHLFSQKGLFGGFQLITLLFALRPLTESFVQAWILQSYGAGAYGQMLLYIRITGWVFNGLIFLGFILISIKINKVVLSQDRESVQISKT
jgi:hypothetical protein